MLVQSVSPAALLFAAHLGVASAAPLGNFNCFRCFLPKEDGLLNPKLSGPSLSPRPLVPEHVDSSSLYPKPTTLSQALQAPQPEMSPIKGTPPHLASHGGTPRSLELQRSYSYHPDTSQGWLGLSRSPSPEQKKEGAENALHNTPVSVTSGRRHASMGDIPHGAGDPIEAKAHGTHVRTNSAETESVYSSGHLFSIPISNRGSGRLGPKPGVLSDSEGEYFSIALSERRTSGASRFSSKPGSSADSKFSANRRQLTEPSSQEHEAARVSSASTRDDAALISGRSSSAAASPPAEPPKKVKLYQYMRKTFLDMLGDEGKFQWRRRPSNFDPKDTQFSSSP